MKLFRLFSLLLLPVALFAAPVESKISAVTVYADRAVVTRAGTAELTPGVTELIFANLPQGLDDRSLQVSGKGTAQATILDVTAKRAFVDFAANPRVKQLEDDLKTLSKQNRALVDRGNILNSQTAALEKVENSLFAPPTEKSPRLDIAQVTPALNYLSEQKAKLAKDRADLDNEQEALQAKIAAVQNQLNELRGSAGRAFKNVVVRVSSTQAGSLDVTLAYTVANASWAPNYDARVTSGERAVALNYFGQVRQNTGEDWKDVALTLSTARPSLGGAAPELFAWYLNVNQPEVIELSPFSVTSERRQKAAPAPAAMALIAGPPEPVKASYIDAEAAEATIEAGATSASFKIAITASVPSDNTPQKIPITSAKLEALPEYATVPKRVQTAYLTSKVTNTTEFPLLAGAMNVFLDGTFVATSRLATVMPTEKFDLALGADEGISVKHKRIQRFQENTGLTNSGVRITYEYLLTIQNNKKTAEKIVVTDQVPVSRNEKIVVKVLSPDVKTVKPDAEGTLKWTLDLKPGEKRELTVKFTVEYPKDVNVFGLEKLSVSLVPTPLTLLVDNGSLEPAATFGLRGLAAKLAARIGEPVEPISLLHSSAIAPERIGGVHAEILFPALERRLAAGVCDFLVLPLFFGPSGALTGYLPENLARLKSKHPQLNVHIAPHLHRADDDRLARILADHVRTEIVSADDRVALVDHGSPVAAVTQVRNELAQQVAMLLGSEVAMVAPCSMERRPAPEYDFCKPLLADLLASEPWNGSRVIVAMQFLLSGRHAGPAGDVAEICAQARMAHPQLRTKMTKLVAEHSLLIEILVDRWRAVRND